VNTTIRNLASCLSANGVPFAKIPDCVRDLGFIVAEKPSVGAFELNEAMKGKGWQNFRADERILLHVLLIVAEALIEAEPGKRLWFEEHPSADSPALYG
jgi:hypothetical protein